jgi:molybdopterin-guanine dinucleotide biosynthesis protein A
VPMQARHPTGVIFAGGRSTRMGHDKALVPFRGRPMIEHVAAALREAGLPVIVAGWQESIADADSIPDLPDVGGGPAAGLASVYEHLDGGDLFAVAVDQPLLRPETVHRLLQLPGDAVVPIAGGHPQVTCALYREPCRAALQTLLREGDTNLRMLLGAVAVTYVRRAEWSRWGEDGSSWKSLDTPEALQTVE